MKLVFICQDAYPYNGACSSILNKILRSGLKSDDISIHVICSGLGLEGMQQTEKINDITIHRICWWYALPLSSIKKMVLKEPDKAIWGFINKANQKLPGRGALDFHFDSSIVRQIVECLKAIRCNSNDVIVPVAGLYEAVQAAFIWKKRMGSPVLIYQVDPCSTNQAYLSSSLVRRLAFEKNMYHNADCVITTPIIKEELRQTVFDKDLDRAISMEFPNIEIARLGQSEQPHHQTGVIMCVFSGMVYRNVRNPEFTLKLFNALGGKSVRLSMVGVSRVDVRAFVPDVDQFNNVDFYGYVPEEENQRHIDEADMLVNIGNSVLNQVPSKVFSYIATGKPIINICVSHQCPTLKYMEKYPLAINLFQTDEFQFELKRLTEFISEANGKRVMPDIIKSNFFDCSAEYCAQLMKETIRRLHDGAIEK